MFLLLYVLVKDFEINNQQSITKEKKQGEPNYPVFLPKSYCFVRYIRLSRPPNKAVAAAEETHTHTHRLTNQGNKKWFLCLIR